MYNREYNIRYLYILFNLFFFFQSAIGTHRLSQCFPLELRREERVPPSFIETINNTTDLVKQSAVQQI